MKATTVKVELDEEAGVAAPPIETPEDPDVEPPKPKTKPAAAAPEPASPVLKQIALEEERSLKDWLDTYGTQGAFRVGLYRTEPKFVSVRGRGQVKCDGFLNSYDYTITEEDIQRQWGGGTFVLKVTRPGKSGSHQFQKSMQRSVQIAGEPSSENLPGGANTAAATPEPAVAAPSENPSVAKELTSLVKELVHDRDRGERRDQPRGIDPAIQILLEQNAAQLAAMRAEMAARDRELSDLRKTAAVPVSDPIKDQILSSMIAGRDGQVEAIKVRTESELRQSKEGHLQDLKRLEDRHDRDVAAMRQSHELAIAQIKASYEREIAAMRSSQDVSLGAAKATFDVQAHTLGAEVKRLERDNDELRRDVRELRERKDKSMIEQASDLKKLKEALGAGDEEGATTMDQIMGALPALLEQGGKILASRGAAAPAPVQPVTPQPAMIARTRSGQHVLVKDGRAVPVQRKPKVINNDAGAQIVAPVVDPAQVASLVQYLESAYKAGQDPEIVAQSGRSALPEEVLKWIKENDTEQTSGVDLFMRRVANLASNSPLSTQSGRNWIRKVGKALVGDQLPDAE